MLAEIGLVSTFLAFLAAIYAIIVSVYGGRQHNEQLVVSARNAAMLTFPLLVIATGSLVVALLTGQYQMSYVWSVTDPATAPFYRFTALWGSQKGSILFWCFLMSLFAAAALLLNWRSHRRLMPYVIAYTMATLAFFLALVLFFENPFMRWWLVGEQAVEAALIPAGGIAPTAQRLAETANGLNPLLRHFGMIIHPPMLYLGFVGFTIPFAFAMAALASGDLSTNWIKATRRWALVAWLFLSLGLLLGGRWAYDVLGWGGYWGWDPVENAAFLPWLIGTAFLHSVMIQEKRGMLKVWNMFLVIGTFSAVIFGTFATRSGLIDSVHAFARSEIGFPMFFFWTIITLISVGLILWRWNRGELKDDHQFANLFSRETLFVLNNVVFVLLFVAIFWGSFGAPVVSELFLQENITLGTDYFLRVTPPLFIALYILMGIAPLSAWGATSLRRLGKSLLLPLGLTAVLLVVLVITQHTTDPGALFGYGIVSLAGFVAIYETYRGVLARHRSVGESWPRALVALYARNRRRYGGYTVHLGITIIGIGVIGSTLFQQQTQRTLNVGDTVDFGGYIMRYDGFTNAIAEDGRQMQIADVTVSQNGQEVAHLRPRQDIYPTMPMTIAGSYWTG
ncbi:MAG TPA: cytochrome c-type biogenesis CcmF C-terminal domain-containing protein, partial [Phototrophicaceae bacterium]|nr:cytochrome c-type biogenesis CcmF C-terminal domain-containing protein [Phototrophicaceae bacterium]